METTSKAVCDYIFRKYMSLNYSSYGNVVKRYTDKRQSINQRYYDHLGLIDTLGYSVEHGFLTYHYSSEMGSIYAFRLTSGKWAVYYNDCEKLAKIVDSLDKVF